MHDHIARQPIFDKNQNVFAYELLFRDSKENAFNNTDGDRASSSVISQSLFHVGLDSLTGGKKVFINFTRELLLQQFAEILPKEDVVVEILEDVAPDADVLDACKKLKSLGYTLALDDFAGETSQQPWLELVDIIKVDLSLTNSDDLKDIAQRFPADKYQLLAEKVETHEQFSLAKSLGYSLFQGYFFSRPDVVSHRKIPQSKTTKIQLLKELNQPLLNMDDLEEVIKRDVSISFKLLKYINSASFGLRNEISSIRHALNMLGLNNIRKWATLIVMADLGEDKPNELISCALTRAKFCENLANATNQQERSQDSFLMGMLSLLDAMTDIPLGDILEEIPISNEIKSSLLNDEGELKAIYQAAIAYERANWSALASLQEALGIDEETMPEIYTEALTWADNIQI